MQNKFYSVQIKDSFGDVWPPVVLSGKRFDSKDAASQWLNDPTKKDERKQFIRESGIQKGTAAAWQVSEVECLS